MIIRIDPTGAPQGFRALLEELSGYDEVEGVFVLACADNGFTSRDVDDALRNSQIPIFGGVFPAIVYNDKLLQKGTIVAGLKKRPEIHIVRDLSDEAVDLEKSFHEISLENEQAGTMFVLFDGYAQRINSMVDSLYNHFGFRYNYIGGGAGSINPSVLDMEQKLCLFTNQGMIKDGLVLGLVPMKSGIGSAHGWHKINGPYRVTESSGNAIQSLDWRPAFDVYREIIEDHSDYSITHENFFDIAKRFPFGMSRIGSEVIVRDPFTVEEQSLIVATEIPQESFIDILTGNLDSLVKAAGESYHTAMNDYHGQLETTVFLIDCISRVLFLGDHFSRELEAVNPSDSPLIGALSLGEIANSGNEFMELYNKTCCVAILGD